MRSHTLLRVVGRCGLALLLMLLAPVAQAQTAPRLWQLGGAADDEVVALAHDAAGNTYLTGYFSGQQVFGTDTLRAAQMTAYLLKLDAGGQVQWARQLTGTQVAGASVGVDGRGNVYVFGSYAGPNGLALSSTVTLAPHPTPTGFYGLDVFLAKYTAAGTPRWVRRGGGGYNDQPGQLAVDAQGNCSLTGIYNVDAAFGAFTLVGGIPNGSGPGIGLGDLFVARYDSAGTARWAHSLVSSNGEQGKALALLPDGGCVVAGQSDASFTSDQGERYTITTGGFVARYAADGTLRWCREVGPGLAHTQVGGLAADRQGGFYLGGALSGAGQYTAPNGDVLTRSSGGNPNPFVLRYDSTGAVRWARQGIGSAVVRTVACDAADHCLALGILIPTNAPGPFGAVALNRLGDYDGFAVELDPTGTALGGDVLGGTTRDDCWTGAPSAGGGWDVGGFFTTQMTAVGLPLTARGGRDGYLLQHYYPTRVLGLTAEANALSRGAWPNPAHDALHLPAPATAPATLHDALGRVVRTVPTGEVVLSVRGLAPGLYVLRRPTAAGLTTQRVVVE